MLCIGILFIFPVTADSLTFHSNDAKTGSVQPELVLFFSDDDYLNGQNGLKTVILTSSKNYSPAMPSFYGTAPLAVSQGGTLDTNEFPSNLPRVNIQGSGAVDGAPTITNGKVYFGTGPTGNNADTSSMGIYCVDFINNKLVWNYTISHDNGTPAGAVSGITVSGDYAYIGGINGKLYCFNAQNGASGPLWNTTVLDTTPGIGLSSTPLILNNTVYVTTQTPARLLGFSYDSTNHTVTEELNISLTTSDSSPGSSVSNFSSPSTDGTYIYSSGQNGIVKVDPVNKSVTNSYSANGATSTPVYACGTVWSKSLYWYI